MTDPHTQKQEEIFKVINQSKTLIEIVDFLLQKKHQNTVYTDH
jgi:hypothetical protein